MSWSIVLRRLRLVMEGANFNMVNPNSARNSRYKAGVQKRVRGDAGACEALLLYYGTSLLRTR